MVAKLGYKRPTQGFCDSSLPAVDELMMNSLIKIDITSGDQWVHLGDLEPLMRVPRAGSEIVPYSLLVKQLVPKSLVYLEREAKTNIAAARMLSATTGPSNSTSSSSTRTSISTSSTPPSSQSPPQNATDKPTDVTSKKQKPKDVAARDLTGTGTDPKVGEHGANVPIGACGKKRDRYVAGFYNLAFQCEHS